MSGGMHQLVIGKVLLVQPCVVQKYKDRTRAPVHSRARVVTMTVKSSLKFVRNVEPRTRIDSGSSIRTIIL
jgi:hypothetical protein